MNEHPKLLSPVGNFCVVHVPGRSFPGVVFQGDSLNILLSELRGIRSAVGGALPRTVCRDLDEVVKRLEEVQLHYETVLGKNGFSLPYAKEKAP